MQIVVEPVSVYVPTNEEFFKIKYKNEPDYLKTILQRIKKGMDVQYSLYDLKQLIEKEGETILVNK